MADEKVHQDYVSDDPSLELRRTKALEKIALNMEALVMFFEGLNTDEWDNRIQWYLDMYKRAYLDEKLDGGKGKK